MKGLLVALLGNVMLYDGFGFKTTLASVVRLLLDMMAKNSFVFSSFMELYTLRFILGNFCLLKSLYLLYEVKLIAREAETNSKEGDTMTANMSAGVSPTMESSVVRPSLLGIMATHNKMMVNNKNQGSIPNNFIQLFNIIIFFYIMYTNIIIFITAILVSRYIYSYYTEASDFFESSEHYQLVSDYYIGDKLHSTKPILWIHTSNEINARQWESFYSRTSTNLNQPYLHITMKSIYDKCHESFNICLIDDDVFRKLLSWNIKLDDLADPIKSHYRQLGLSMILYYYGGMVVPQSFLCKKDLIDIYKSNTMFVTEEVNRTTLSERYVPGLKMMGCKRKNPLMKQCVDFQETLYKNKTSSMEFQGCVQTWLSTCGCTIVEGDLIGIKKRKTKQPVTLRDLLGTQELDLPMNLYGIYVPREEILSNTKYEWFARMSPEQILASPFQFAEHVQSCY